LYNRSFLTQDIVTGGTGGLGFEACRTLLEHGLLGLCIFDLESAFQTQAPVQQLREEFPSAKIIEEIVDVTDEKNVHQGVNNAVALLGSVEILLCFAGIARSSHSAETSLEEWQKVIGVNATGSWLCAQAVGR
jgi:sorbose reductase